MRSPSFKYNQNLKKHARNLRHKQTDAERLLWVRLRNRQLAGLKFRRQFPIAKYIVDFYCNEKKLAIEVDGGQHTIPKYRRYDAKRTYQLNREGIKLIRFWDNEVLQNIDGVLEKILIELQK